MIPELGHFALILALVLAVVQAVLPQLGAWRGNDAFIAVARPAAVGQCLFLLLAMLCLAWAFQQNDFSVLYVAEHSNSMLPRIYRFAAVWGGHEGSLLLWAFMLSGWGVAVAVFSRRLPEAFVARVLAVMGLVGCGFLVFMLTTSNPFERLLPAAADGADLNPLLQDPLLAIHPPMLYMGYVGFSVAYAFAIAALIEGKLDSAWARWSRPWTLAAWTSLSLGICLGSFWAYYELGWGGWWFWDPVENASFMPWLVGTALIHSLAVTEKRGSFKNWTVLLAITAFSLSLLGTFLVRSGVLTSVHAFAVDPARGLFILAFLGVVVSGSLLLYAWRAPQMGFGGRFAWISRETFLLANNVLLVAAMATVLLGTLYPLLLDALGLGKISVGPPYFGAVFVPLMTPVIFLMGIGPLARWKQASLPTMVLRLRVALAVGVATAILVPWLMGHGSVWVSLGILLAAWLFSSLSLDLAGRLRALDRARPWRALTRLPRSVYGMFAAHGGIAVFIVGVTLSGGYSVDVQQRMAPGEQVQLGAYRFRFEGVRMTQGPNYEAAAGTVTVSRGDRVVTVLHPEKRNYTVQGRVMTEAAIDGGILRHLYVALGEPAGGGGAWSLRLYVKPFVQWIWMGVVCIALGGVLAASDRRYRLARRQRKAAASSAAKATVPRPAAAPQYATEAGHL
jgi:cytochrome c-type biogenesis protein CcmF